MDYAKESLRLHGEWKGKIEVIATVPVENEEDLSADYIIPKAFDPRVGPAVAKAVAQAARDSGVARV